ncbi:MAG: prepilin-type N-terminal cleavage/methylation domain-containing protein [Proteobacteria bacterium]|nr:prepilin-type N-terminal cleavage/methylation domain-containing protein [Pseudomonadota bacterium]
MRNSQQGFTLIELLVVIAIIGILAAIAIPQFQQYRLRGYDSAARSDLRNAAVAQEAYFVDNNSYISCDTSTCPTLLPGLRSLSQGTTLSMTGTATGFTGTATNSKGSGASYNWDSANGGMQQ